MHKDKNSDIARHRHVVGIIAFPEVYEAMRAFYADRLRHTLKQSARDASEKELTDEALQQLLANES